MFVFVTLNSCELHLEGPAPLSSGSLTPSHLLTKSLVKKSTFFIFVILEFGIFFNFKFRLRDGESCNL